MSDRSTRRDEAVITGFNDRGDQVFEKSISLHDYWDASHPVIDEDGFRQAWRIRKLVGVLVGPEGNVLQEFENRYNASGTIVSGWARQADGTETRFPPE